MREPHIIELLRLLGYEESSMVIRDNWVNVCCPLADFKHSSGQDHHPSAGILINNDGPSLFKCFSCTPNAILLQEFISYRALHLRRVDSDVFNYCLRHEIMEPDAEDEKEEQLFNSSTAHVFNFNRWIEEPTELSDPLPTKFPDNLLLKFPELAPANDLTALAMKDYLINFRKISLSAISALGLRYHKQKNLIIFPLTDLYGNVQVLRARVCDVETKIMFTISNKHFNSSERLPTIRDSGACFGLHLIDPHKPVIIVESETDCLLLRSYGFDNVVATTTASFSRSQIFNIPSPNLWVGFDNDPAGKKATINLINISNGKLIHVINWEHAGAKDPGEAQSRLDIARAMNKKMLVDKKNFLTYKRKYSSSTVY